MLNLDDYIKENLRLFLSVANTETGRRLLQVKKRAKIVKISKESFHQVVNYIDGIPLTEATFFWDMRMVKLAQIVEKISICNQEYKPVKDIHKAVRHFLDYRNITKDLPYIYLDQLTFNTFTAGAGRLLNDNVNTFALWHDNTTANDGTASSYLVYCDKSGVTSSFNGGRIYLPVNTSSIGGGGSVIGTQLNFNAQLANLVDSPVTVALTQTAQSDTTALATSEWGNKGAGVSGGTVSANSTSVIAKTITGNSTTYGWINTLGVSKLGIRENTYDMGNVAPTISGQTSMTITSPSLIVTYLSGTLFYGGL